MISTHPAETPRVPEKAIRPPLRIIHAEIRPRAAQGHLPFDRPGIVAPGVEPSIRVFRVELPASDRPTILTVECSGPSEALERLRFRSFRLVE